MDEITQALANAINTGSELAPTALYGFFVLRAVDALSASATVLGVASMVYRLVRLKLTTPSDNMLTYLQTGRPVMNYDDIGRAEWVPSDRLLRQCGFIKRVETKDKATER